MNRHLPPKAYAEQWDIDGLDAHIKEYLGLDLPLARIFVPLGEPTTSAALSAYDDFAEVRTADGAVGFGAIEQGILRRLG